MRIPSIGDVLEETTGVRWRVVGVRLDEGVEEERPERKTLYVDLDPVQERLPLPAAFREMER